MSDQPAMFVPSSSVTHAELVRVAYRWLLGTRKCSVAFAELATAAMVIPDAIGWACKAGARSPVSVLIECKVSRADFRREAEKPHRRSGRPALGRERWFLAPAGILAPGDLHEPILHRGWGLLAWDGKRVRKVVGALRDHTEVVDEDSERFLLVSALRRHALGVAFDAEVGRFETVQAQIDKLAGT